MQKFVSVVIRPLNSDELGDAGEAKFAAACKLAKLIVNKSERDRRGWDYIVEWPADQISNFSLDTRPVPLSCHVQVKTMWSDSRSVSVRLSAMEWLTKELKPTFIYCLRIKPDLTIFDVHMIHVRGSFLAEIIRRLREAHATGTAPNKTTFNFALNKWGVLIGPNGYDFRRAVEAYVGLSMSDYASTKANELKTVGFDKGALTLQITISGTTEDELIDAMLGLGSVDGELHGGTEERFGIKLPYEVIPLGNHIISMEPAPSDATIIFRTGGDASPMVFQAKMYVSPVLEIDFFKFRLKADLFEVIIRVDGRETPSKITAQMNTKPELLKAASLSALQWKNYYELMVALWEGALQMEFQSSSMSRPFVGTLQTDEGVLDLNYAKAMLSLTAKLDGALARTGYRDSKMQLESVVDAALPIDALDAFINEPGSIKPHRFRSPNPKGAQFADREIPTIYVHIIPFGEWSLAYCGRAIMIGDVRAGEIDWTASQWEFVAVARISSGEEAAKHFVERMQQNTKIEACIVSTNEPMNLLDAPKSEKN